MRFALVIVFFVGLHYLLRPAPLPDSAMQAPQTSPPVELQPSPDLEKTAARAPAATAAPPAPPPQEEGNAAEEIAAPGSVTNGAVEKPGEERTSSYTRPSPEARGPEIEQRIQNELVRLGCMTGRPERGWGKKSRAALRRFTTRAKPKGRTAPNQALLTTLGAYPDNYCRLCKPGQKACQINKDRRR